MSVRRRSWKTKSGESRSAWVVDYADRDGRHIASFKRKADADDYDAEVRTAVRAGQRTVPLGPMVVNTLKAWRLASTSKGLVFATRTGKSLDHPSLWARMLAPAQIKAGVVTAGSKPKYSFHALRHFYASWCINRRVDGGLELPLKMVQARLGHASIQMTADRYGHLFPSGDDGAELAAAEKVFLG